jgi:hypothetical protein
MMMVRWMHWKWIALGLLVTLTAGCSGSGGDGGDGTNDTPDVAEHRGISADQGSMEMAEVGVTDGSAPTVDMAVSSDSGGQPTSDMRVDPDAARPTGFRCTRDFECNDSNPCTDDRCIDGECTNPINEATCEDDIFCNGVEQCQNGVCEPGALPCPTAEDCNEETDRCLACDVDEQCPESELQSATPCQYADRCVEEGARREQIAYYACQDRECVAEVIEQDGVCNRDSDGSPCGGGASCLNGDCPRDPIVRGVSAGFTNFNARLYIGCRGNNQMCIVEGNRDRMNRGSMTHSCEIQCPAGGLVEVCCSNGSAPCGGSPVAPRANIFIQSLGAEGFTETNCGAAPDGPNEAQCQGTVGDADVEVNCSFAR